MGLGFRVAAIRGVGGVCLVLGSGFRACLGGSQVHSLGFRVQELGFQCGSTLGPQTNRFLFLGFLMVIWVVL